MRLFLVLCFFSAGSAFAAVDGSPTSRPSRQIFEKILAQGVPEHGLRKIFEYLDKVGTSYQISTYTCAGLNPSDVKVCDDKKRTPTTKVVAIEPRDYAVVVDFMRKSTEKRFFLINLKTGAVMAYLASHGKGSGETVLPYKFSNTKDSKQTSLGMYILGEIFQSSHGITLRMYGIEKSNDQAYNRDIVFHGAEYAEEEFIKRINPNTKLPYDRLGVSWGCPAVGRENAKKLVPLIKEGVLIYHDHVLAEEALSGHEVSMPKP